MKAEQQAIGEELNADVSSRTILAAYDQVQEQVNIMEDKMKKREADAVLIA